MSLPLCAAAALLPAAVFLVQLAIVRGAMEVPEGYLGQYQYHGAKKQYLLVQVPGDFDKMSSTFTQQELQKIQYIIHQSSLLYIRQTALQICQKSRRIGCVIQCCKLQCGITNLSFDLF